MFFPTKRPWIFQRFLIYGRSHSSLLKMAQSKELMTNSLLLLFNPSLISKPLAFSVDLLSLMSHNLTHTTHLTQLTSQLPRNSTHTIQLTTHLRTSFHTTPLTQLIPHTPHLTQHDPARLIGHKWNLQVSKIFVNDTKNASLSTVMLNAWNRKNMICQIV